jgi:hypothetical protein
MLNVTAAAVTGQVAGIPETVILLVAPPALASGITTLIGPEQNCVVVVVEDEAIKRTAASPRHIATGLGVTVGGGGV